MNNIIESFNNYITQINTNKYFIGLSMILLNIGSKIISIQLPKSTEEYVKMNITKQLLLFSMAFIGTRCIVTSLILTAVFIILTDHLFNDESKFCIVPYKYRVLHKLDKLIDENNDGFISDTEINSAIAILERAKKERQKKEQKNTYMSFHNYINSSY